MDDSSTQATRALEGEPHPLGVTWVDDGRAVNFALYSKHAESVVLQIYGDNDVVRPVLTHRLDYRFNKTGPIWHCRLSSDIIANGAYYAYQIDGPGPATGFGWHSFDNEKLLLDPYATGVYFPERFCRQAACRPGSNVGQAALGILPSKGDTFDWGDDLPRRHDVDLVIYELHVRGFTRRSNSGVISERRGTFLGVIDKIPYLLELGTTAVELMPVFQFDPQANDYWGYMPLLFFAPNNGYAVESGFGQQVDEFRELVKALHQAGIEVILDVVYNHTCEGDERGPKYCFKGIDNTTYYFLTGDPEQPFANFSGTGNTLHTANRAVRRLIIDSLHYWDRKLHVDGFRFDLASIFARGPDGSLKTDDPPLLAEIDSYPSLTDNRLIAEPWDPGGAYLLGQKFPGQCWMQWNSRYRDALQRFVRGDQGMVPELMTRMYGSTDLFPDDRLHACRPIQSVNYVTSHDGFTLYDLVSYDRKQNWANGHQNLDGASDYSWNCGWEGDEKVPPEVLQVRKQQCKNFCCLLLLSSGAPMFRMGDEFLQTQFGNNNPYNQDNETTWLDWERLETHCDIFRFFRLMIAFRKAHPSIGRRHFWREDIRWYGTGHTVDISPESQQLAYCLQGAALGDDDLYVMINGGTESVRFGIHGESVADWRLVIDTCRRSPDDIIEPGNEPLVNSPYYQLAARSVVVMRRAAINC